MMSGNRDISLDRNILTKKLRFFIPARHVFHDMEDKNAKTILEEGYFPCHKIKVEQEQLDNLEKENLSNLFIDTIRLQNSTIYFNDKSVKRCIPNSDAQDEEKEAAENLLRFDHFLKKEFKHGKENLLQCYQQSLITFPGDILFQALGKLGHTLREKTFHSRIICNKENNFFPCFITRIEKLKYIPKGKDLFEKNNAIELSGYLETRLQFFESEKRCGFDIEIITDSSQILALLLGQLDNELYVSFLEQCVLLKKKCYFLSDFIFEWFYKKKFNDQMMASSGETLFHNYKKTLNKIEMLFEKVALMHGLLDILLASQDRERLSSEKLKDDFRKLNRYYLFLNDLSFYCRRHDIQMNALVQYRKEWSSRPKKRSELEVFKQIITEQQSNYFQ